MKPAHLRVFDGLRITTGHMNHLQAAIRSGFEDIREILGPGQVQSGMEVAFKDAHVTVEPGLAFDWQGNRIVCDDPITISADLGSADGVKYVCVKHSEVEEGSVEGQNTMIFDSCAVTIEAELPKQKDNLVALAKLVRHGDEVSVEPIAAETSPSPAETKKPAPVPVFVVKQGVLRLGGTRADLTVPADEEVLARNTLPVDFAPRSMTSHVLLSATVTLDPGDAAVEFDLKCHGQGEATIAAPRIDQFAVSSCPAYDFSEDDMARLYLKPPATADLDVLGNLYVAIRLGLDDAGSLQITAILRSSVMLGADAVKSIQTRRPVVDWQALTAWKALGSITDS